jgi:CRP-like cAMP-binding protein
LKKTAVVAAATPPKAEKKAKDPHPSAGFSSPSEPLAATATAIKEEKKWKKKSMAAAALPSKAEKKVKDTPASTARSSPESTEDRPPVAIPAVATATSSTLPPMEETKSKQTSVAAPPPPEDEEMANDPPPFARTSSDTAEEEEEEAATIAAFPPNEDKKLKWALAVPQPPPPVHSTDWQNPVVSSASPTPSPKEEKKLKKPGTVVPQAREEKKVRDASPSATSSSDSTDLQKPVVAASLKKLKKPLVTTELQKPVVAASPKKLRKSSVTGPPTKAEETAKGIPQDSSSSSESTTVKNPIVETPTGPSQQPKIQKKLQKPAVEEPKKEKKATEKKTFDANFTVNQWNKGRQQLETIPWSKTKKTREELREENASNNVPARPPLDVFQRPLVVKDDYQAPVYTKSKHEEKTIERALSKVLPLDNMLKRGVSKLIAAFEKTHVGAGTEIGGEDDCDEDGEDYFYVVQDGKVGVEVDGEEVGELNGGGTIGDVNLFHPSKRGAASFRTKSDVDLFRMNQSTYRSIFQSENIREDKHKLGLVEKIRLFDNTSDANKKKLSYALKPITFKEGEIVVSKHNYGNFFYIVDSGRVRCRDPDRLGRKVPDRIVTSGGYFGDTLLASNDPRSEEVLAETNVKAYRIDGSTFETAIGKPRNVILTPEEAANLQCISELQYKPGKKLKKDQVKNIAAKIVDHTFAKGQTILEAGVEIPAAIYFVRQGVAKVVSGRYNKLKANGDYFGEDLFENARSCCSLVGATRFPVTAVDTLVCGVLKLEDYLSVFEDAAPKTKAKKPKRETIEESEHESEPKQDDEETKTADESMHEETQTSVQVDKVDNKSRRREFKFCNLVKKVMLGEGQFGQVWMVADTTEEPQRPYALKIQSKYELVEQDQAEVCVREKNIMALLDHPMVIKLFASFHDQDFVYLLLDMVNGGELFNLIHQSDGNGLPEKHCKFYAFVLADIISYIHGKNYVYRK